MVLASWPLRLRSRWPKRIVTLTAACALALGAGLVPAEASTPALSSLLPLTFVRAHTDARVVEVECLLPDGAAQLVVTRGSEEVTHVPVSEPGAVRVRVEIPGAEARLSAAAMDSSGTVLAESGHLRIRARSFLPSCNLNIAAGRLLVSGQRVWVRYRATSAAVSLRSERTGRSRRVYSGPVGTLATTYTLPAQYGRNVLVISMRNAWGSSYKAMTVWFLGIAPWAGARYVLVDKSDFTLYRITEERVHSCYPVAIGMPGVETPTGSFVLGRSARASGPWGVLRIPMYTASQWGRLAHNGYYLHGTNEPDSIGTQASSGCVRMYNSDIRRMADLTWPGMRMIVRP